MSNAAEKLDLAPLSPALRREIRDFYQFLLSRSPKKAKGRSACIHRYDFSDLCGQLSWRGDSVAAQRTLRDEW